ncbi:hypothetical protein BKA83DRAFT_4125896 [Pisolithus microcarpus]|nr:hypothetical protein BKA83DRAFT_4125896 [Pisolithus microcarpus]
MPSPIPLSQLSASLWPLLPSVGPCQPTLGHRQPIFACIPLASKMTWPILSVLLRILGITTLSGVLYILFLMVLNISSFYLLFSIVKYCRTSRDLVPFLLMVLQTIYASKPTARRVQPKARPHIKVILSANAHAALKLNQYDKMEKFKKDLDDAWQLLDKVMKTLASKHHKSVRHVQNDLHLAASSTSTLLDLIHENRMEYHELSAKDKNHLVEEFSEFRELKAIGVHVTTKSKVNDITHTLKAVENELHNLRSQTGVETVLYATRGMTDLPLRGVAFATEGIADFMGSVMGIDTQDLVSKLEGFAVQGIKGAAENHQQCISNICATIRNLINCQLWDVTGDLKAKMQWAQYFRNVVTRYWWEMGTTYWKALSDDEFEQLQQKRSEELESGGIEECSRRTRSDKAIASNKKYKSAATIDDKDDEGDVGPGGSAQASVQPTGVPRDVVATNDDNSNSTGQTTTTMDVGPTAAHTSDSASVVDTNPTTMKSVAGQSTLGPNFGTNDMEFSARTEWQEFLDDFADSILDFDAATVSLY